MSQPFDLQKARAVDLESLAVLNWSGLRDAYRDALDEIERLQAIIMGPVESFGTLELVAWAERLQKILSDFPEDERGHIPFIMSMGAHLEKFAKSWNSPVMNAQAKRIAELEGWLVDGRATYMHHLMYGDGAFYLASWTDRARDQLRREGKL